MTKKQLHIVSFDVPFPANYGGVIDVFYRLKALHEIGFEITLHCFEYGRGNQKELEAFTKEVIYYPRKKRVFDWLSRKPFIVQSRRSNLLLENLLKDDAPILFEGLHTTYFLSNPKLKNRTKLVRAHNIEHDYYFKLAEHAVGWRKLYFKSEAKKLKRFERTLKKADVVLPIKSADMAHFSQYSTENCLLNPCFDQKELSYQATEPYVLFHGNLAVNENMVAVKWLCKWVSNELKMDFIVAGKDPDSSILELEKKGFFTLKSNPSESEMDALISSARVHVLVTNQSTGIKLKLIYSLQTSGHVLVNPTMVEGTNLESFCTILQYPSEWKSALEHALEHPLSEDEFEERKKLFSGELNVLKNCRVIEQYLR